MKVLEEQPEQPVEDVSTPVETEVEDMKVADRCDACRAQAMVSVRVSKDAGPLYMCGHCYQKHELALAASGAVVLQDNRHTLLARPTNANAV